jgi:acyl-CoA synthetase (AMP-forming)/AMP-acid ligase II
LLDANGHDVPEGQVGELFSLTPTAFDGYWRQPEATRQAFCGRYCSAGDLAQRDADGFYTLVDRKSNLIITGGEKVYPSEVERVVHQHPSVLEAAVVGLADTLWGESVTAIVALSPGKALGFEELRAFCRKHLAGFKCPRRLILVHPGEIPRSANGKILHRVLRERQNQCQTDSR